MAVILMSIQSKYVRKIFAGTKRWEYRKALPKGHSPLFPLRVIIYSAGEDKAIVGEFIAKDVVSTDFESLMRITDCSADTEAVEWLGNYYGGRQRCGAIQVGATRKYKQPISLSMIRERWPNFLAPQNFIYFNEDNALFDLIQSRT